MDVVESSAKNSGCFRWFKPGHIVMECIEVLNCVHFGRVEAHASEKCVMLTRVNPVAKLVWCTADGLQLMVA